MNAARHLIAVAIALSAANFRSAAAQEAGAGDRYGSLPLSATAEQPSAANSGEVLLAFHKDEPSTAAAAPSSPPEDAVNPLRRPTVETPLRGSAPALPAPSVVAPLPLVSAAPPSTLSPPPVIAPSPVNTASAATEQRLPADSPASRPTNPNPFAPIGDRYAPQVGGPTAMASAEMPPESPLAAPKPTYQPGPKYDSHIEMAGLEIGAEEEDDEETGLPATDNSAAAIDKTGSVSSGTARSIPPLVGGGDPLASAAARMLAPKGAAASNTAGTSPLSKRGGLLPQGLDKLKSLGTAGGGLAVVIGLFIACMLLLRRGSAKASGALPAEAFAVLGRAPLAAQSFAHLLRVGNKLVLVAITPEGAQPLTEVTDPAEVGRLMGLCSSGKSFGPTAEFQQVMSQLAREPARGFLGGEAKAGGKRR